MGWLSVACVATTTAGFAEPPPERPAPDTLTRLAQVRQDSPRQAAYACSVDLSGVVVWTHLPDQFILTDASGAQRVVVDLRAQPALRPGDQVRLQGHALAAQGILRDRLIDNDGLHPRLERSASLYLGAGRHPLRADWFNGPESAELQIDYAGPELPRQPIPESALFRPDPASPDGKPLPGLDYRCYEGVWDSLPAFPLLQVARQGTAAGFDLRVRTRPEEVALQFTGFLQVPREGTYTFWLASDDGSRLSLGVSDLRLTVLGSGPMPAAQRSAVNRALGKDDLGQWTEAEGVVTAVRDAPGGQMRLELASDSVQTTLELEQANAAAPPLFSRIRARGICQRLPGADQETRPGLFVPGLSQLEVLSVPPQPLHAQLTKVAELHTLASGHPGLRLPAHLEGLVVAAVPDQGLFVFQDESGAVLVRLETPTPDLRAGQQVLLEGNTVLEGATLSFPNPVLVDNNGLHELLEKSGAIFLKAGKHSLRVAWFNQRSPSGLELQWQGPELARQPIPARALFRPVFTGAGGSCLQWTNGLEYRAYEGSWSLVPESQALAPIKQGFAPSFDLGVAPRPEDVSLEFSGFLEVPRDGIYTFWLTSDDGSLLFIDEQPRRLVARDGGALPPPAPTATDERSDVWAERRRSLPPPVPVAAHQLLLPEQAPRWSQVEGSVTFVSEDATGLQLELASGTGRMRLEVLERSGRSPRLLLRSRIRALGIPQCTYTPDGQPVAGALLVPSMKQIQLLEVPSWRWEETPAFPIGLLAATNLSRTEEILVRTRGQLSASASPAALLLRDETGALLVETTQPPPLQPDTQVEVLARWTRVRTNVVLRSALYRELPAASQSPPASPPLLSTVEQIKRLSRSEAQRGYPVKIRGVVTAPQIGGFFIQDATWAIYARLQDPAAMALPHAGDYCEVEGVTFAEFAPNIRATRVQALGPGTLPEPLRPTWDQLINGSLDTQYVEVQGIVTAVEAEGLALLTRAGKIKLQLPEAEPHLLQTYDNALIRIRGCVIPGRNLTTQEVELGHLRLSNFAVNVDEPPPADPFAAPLKHTADLLRFDLRAGALQRVKLAGQILHERDGEYFLLEGTNGLRFLPRMPMPLSPGDLVEVVGFPDLGGPCPVLREALVRSTGKAALPSPRGLPADALLNPQRDATWVRVESLLANVNREQSEQVLVCQVGTREWVARLESRHGLLPGLRPGSRLELTGVYASQGGASASDRQAISFELLLNSPSDVKVLAEPSWWSLRHSLAALGLMAVVLLAATLWAFTLKRQVDAQTQVIRQTAEREATLEERARIARELHDTLEQGLAGISLQLNALSGALREAPPESRSILDMARSMVRHGQEEARRTVRNLRLFALEEGDLPTALTHLVDQFGHGAPAQLQAAITGQPRPLPPKVESHLLRVAQEATTNALKHARARTIRLELGYTVEAVRLSIRDDGCGFDAERAAPSEAGHFGLLGMRERAEKLGGRLHIRSAPGQGTSIEVTVPLSPPPSPVRPAV